ncbi:unnamed protein product [Pieris brassicae]|uniref:Uncharacterized protein n=1 Tax=Pieris brassicae TaxID=7116 RepID=A0A9P0XFH2_PIEBR|nr:unnamed protein product [Pieris brassicae]
MPRQYVAERSAYLSVRPSPTRACLAMPVCAIRLCGSPPTRPAIFRMQRVHRPEQWYTTDMLARPWAVPALSYFDFSLAAVARASERTESVLEVRELNERVVENVDENDDPRPKPSVVR